MTTVLSQDPRSALPVRWGAPKIATLPPSWTDRTLELFIVTVCGLDKVIPQRYKYVRTTACPAQMYPILKRQQTVSHVTMTTDALPRHCQGYTHFCALHSGSSVTAVKISTSCFSDKLLRSRLRACSTSFSCRMRGYYKSRGINAGLWLANLRSSCQRSPRSIWPTCPVFPPSSY